MSVQTRIITEDETDLRLDRWFRRHFPDISHSLLEKWLRDGNVRLDGKRSKSNTRLSYGQVVRIPPIGQSPHPSMVSERPHPRPVSDEWRQKLLDAVLYRDEHVIVLNKPAGLAVQGGTGMDSHHLDAMLNVLCFDGERPRLVHRLDKDTSGVLLLGRTASASAKLAASFRSREARKCYWALVCGAPKLSQGRIDAPLSKINSARGGDKVTYDKEEGKRAVTWYRTIDRASHKISWLECEPRTGRTHQLRAHCQLMGTPILGDGKYGGNEGLIEGQGISRKLHLHARAIRIPHPQPKKGFIELTAPLPQHFKSSLDFFGFNQSDAGAPFIGFVFDDEN